MAIRVALHHATHYNYDRPVSLSPHVVQLRPATHCRTPIEAYSLKILPEPHFLNWQQDPFGNYQARLVFPNPSDKLVVQVDLIAELTVINPFDFFLEEYAEHWPFVYSDSLLRDLSPYLERLPRSKLFDTFVERSRSHDARTGRRTIDVLVDINRRVHDTVKYDIRMEPGVFTPEETLARAEGSCRDFAWLLVQTLRHLGLAARFVSGYSIQLKADEKPLVGPAGVAQDATDLHAWAEVYLPGAGWVGLDATSGLFAGEGHIPLACTPDPETAAAISGNFDWTKRGEDDEVAQTFSFAMSVQRIHETPRVTLPYTDEAWRQIEALGHQVDARLLASDVRLTMGGEPTFVSADDPDGAEWNLAAMGPTKRGIAARLLRRLYDRFTPGGLLHEGQGKWYPGEPLPRWALSSYFRKDGAPIWQDPSLFAASDTGTDTEVDAATFAKTLAKRLDITADGLTAAYEDSWYYLWRERRLPVNVDPFDTKLEDEMVRARLARIFEQGLTKVTGYVLPLARTVDGGWMTGPWFFRPERMYLVPGDSPMGWRLPLESLPWAAPGDVPQIYDPDPFAEHPPLPPASAYHRLPGAATDDEEAHGLSARDRGDGERGSPSPLLRTRSGPPGDTLAPASRPSPPARFVSAAGTVRTALCIEPRNGVLHVFMPPLGSVEAYFELCGAIEDTARHLSKKIRIEGYHPPSDPRVSRLQVTPDPGVIEVNIQPAHNWAELVNTTTVLYEEARQENLRAEKFMLDGRHTGTGGGNHLVLGGETASDSPLLRRPDLLRSLVAYWLNHPSLSYLFTGMFVGPTSQAPRVDEARNDSIYELEIAFKELDSASRGGRPPPPWLVDRLFRNLLIDVTGNTHRAEFCVDKLYSPDSSSGRQGLLELRSFEMPPHARMSLTQQLLVRALVAWFWEKPYRQGPVRWGTDLHDRFCLPYFVQNDFSEVLHDLKEGGFTFDPSWFAAHHEFRFPLLGTVQVPGGIVIDLRQAIEPWHVLGEETTGSGTARYVDSSVERVEIKVSGIVGERHAIACNGRHVPLRSTGTNGEFVAGVRYRAWQPPSALHPTIGVHAPLVFDLLDRWNHRAIAGCTYHVSHPGGLAHEALPHNSLEAETRRGARFLRFGHTPGTRPPPSPEANAQFPLTLDLRR